MALVLCLATWSAAPARAGTGEVFDLPAPRTPAAHGITISVDMYGVEGRGYRPIRVTVKALAAAAADRTITFRFRVGDWRGQRYLVSVLQDIELPGGQRSAEAIVAVPQYQAWPMFWWDTFVDGQHAAELSVDPKSPPGGNSNIMGATPRTLIVGSEASDTEMLNDIARAEGRALLPREAARAPAGARATSVGSMGAPGTAQLSLDELPVRWIDYSQYDILVFSLEELQTLADQRPPAWAAVSRWTRLGGNLWITDVDAAGRDLIDRLTGEPLDTPGAESLWKPTDASRAPQVVEEYPEGPWGVDVEPDVSPPVNVDPRRAKSVVPGSVVRHWQMGRIYVFEDAAQASVTLSRMNGIAHFVDFQRDVWPYRHGVLTEQPTEDFWSFLIAGVGLAPVIQFQILITLFVILLGPVNYYLLRRWKRLHLMLVTVPLGAVVVALAIFGYALVADGLGVRARVRSYTELDQATGEAVCWSRQAYYAGLAPADGLSYDADTLVLPLHPSQNDDAYYGAPPVADSQFALQWDDRARLTDGWLDARTQTQMLALRATRTKRQLNITPGDNRLAVENRLGGRLECLLVVDEQGEFHWGTGIAHAARVDLEPIKLGEAALRLSKVEGSRELSPPPEMLYGTGSSPFGIRRRGYYRGYIDDGFARFGYPNQRTGLLETGIATLRKTPGELRKLMPRGSYLAVLRDAPWVELGVADAQVEGFHVVRGNWSPTSSGGATP